MNTAASHPAVQIRPARPADAESLVRLCAAHAAFEMADYDPSGKADGLAALLFGPSHRLRCLVASHDRQLVGYATWSEQVSTWDASVYGYMDCLYLDAASRGQGIGRRLVAEVVREAIAAGCRSLEWQTPPFNTKAMVFYRRLGATEKEKVRFFLDAQAMAGLTHEPDSPSPPAPMSNPTVWVFFYGTFMSARVLREHGLPCESTTPARLSGYALSVRPRVNLVASSEASVYGGLAEVRHHELAMLYDGLREDLGIVYHPYPVIAEVQDPSLRSALCYIAAASPDAPPDPAYIAELALCAVEMDAPPHYIAHIESFADTSNQP
ncbi:MAG: hypothetical protein Rubg2KO_11330 [Rubricoccaceae bacterium]